jgi:hypothetical protein
MHTMSKLLLGLGLLSAGVANAQGHAVPTPAATPVRATWGHTLEQVLKEEPQAQKLNPAVTIEGMEGLAILRDRPVGSAKLNVTMLFAKGELRALAFSRPEAKEGTSVKECQALVADFTALWGKPTREGESKDQSHFEAEWSLKDASAHLDCNVNPNKVRVFQLVEKQVISRPAAQQPPHKP